MRGAGSDDFDWPWTRATLGRVLAFVLAMLVVQLLLAIEAAVTDGEGGANIGAGLAFFAVQSLGAGMWALRDGGQGVRAPPLFVRWGIIALVAAVVGPVFNSVAPPWSGNRGSASEAIEVLLSDLVGVSPYTAASVFVPAVLGGAIGLSLAGARPARGARAD